jgi:hypothetical protein
MYQQTLKRYVSRQAWQVLVSACHDEPAFDDATVSDGQLLRKTRAEAGRHSPFAAALLEGLSGAADYTEDGLIIASELELYARSIVEQATETRQTPQLYKLERHDRGEFVFQVPGTAISLPPAPALRPENCPYRGTQAFAAEDRALFFGRRTATKRLIELVKTQAFTAVIGPSGSGKSSLLQAGLAPELRADPETTVVIACPGPDPIAGICNEIPRVDSLSTHPTAPLGRIDEWMASNANGRLVIIVDQAEQLMTRSPESARDSLLRELGHAIERHSTRLRIVFGVRSEYEPVLAQSPLRDHWEQGKYEVPAPTQDELREMIERPARYHELSFEPKSLIDTLINAVYMTPGALGTLSSSLGDLYKRVVDRDVDRLISNADYEAMGGVNGLLERRASATLQSLTDVAPAYAMTGRRILLRMTTQRNGEWVRQCADPADFVTGDVEEDARGETLLRAFERDRLLVRSHEGWDLAHDALASTGPALLTSSEKNSGHATCVPALITGFLAELAEAARVWARHGKQAANLWQNDRHRDRLQWLQRECKGYFSALERDFVRRSVARRRLRPIQKLALVFAVIAISVVALVGWNRYFRRCDEYYVGYVRRWGAPMGIHPLSATEASRRAESVKLSRRGRSGSVESAEIVRYGGRCASEPHLIGYQPALEVMNGNARGRRRPCRWEFRYDSGTDIVSQEVTRDVDGHPLYILAYRPVTDPRTALAQYLDTEGHSIRSGRGDAELIEFHRNGQGLDVEIHYLLNDSRTPAISERAIHAEQVSYDSEYNITSTRYLDQLERPTYDKNGVAGWRATYDARGDKLDQTYIDTAGDATHDKTGISRYEFLYDAAGTQTGERWFDEQGNPVPDDRGVAGWQVTLDARANMAEITNLDETGAPTADINGVVRQRTWYDDRGNSLKIRNFDQEGQPVRDKSGAAGWNMLYDAHGNLLKRLVVDEHDQLARDREGIAGWRRSYDEHGNNIEEVYLDEAGVPSPPKTGIARMFMSYDERGNQIAIEYRDARGESTPDKDGITSIRMSYDSRGNMIDTIYFGKGNKWLCNPTGVAHVHKTYDALGNLTEQATYDENDGPTPGDAGVPIVRMSYDDWGNQRSIAYLDEIAHPTLNTSGISIAQMSYDRFGNRIRTSYLDTLGLPARTNDGIAGFDAQYDYRGNEIRVSYFDESGHSIRNRDGYAGAFFAYDAHGNKVEELYLDESNNPTHNRDGMSRCRYVFDVFDNLMEASYLDEDGRPIRNKASVAIVRRAP